MVYSHDLSALRMPNQPYYLLCIDSVRTPNRTIEKASEVMNTLLEVWAGNRSHIFS